MSTTVNDLTESRAAREFAKVFGSAPCWIASAPGRVNLIGEHTDYNDGFVLPMAIEHRTAIAASLTNDQIVTLHSLTTGDVATFKINDGLKPGVPDWQTTCAG